MRLGIRSSSRALRFARRGIHALLIAGLGIGGLVQAQQPQPRIAASAERQMLALNQIQAERTKIQSKIDSRLFLGVLNQRRDARLAVLTDFRFVRPEADGMMPIEIIFADTAGIKAAVELVAARGGAVTSSSYRYQLVGARVHLEDIEALAALPSVRLVRKAIPVFTNAINVSQGDATHGANEARAFFGTNGTGVKVCVLSDGVDSLGNLCTGPANG